MRGKRDPQLRLAFLPRGRKGGLDVDLYDRLMTQLRDDAQRIAARFRLPKYELDADRAEARERYGLCYSDGRIRVRLVHVRTGRMLKYSALIDTVVHELAHLRHMNHGPRWEALYRRMLAWARAEGIYEPAWRETDAEPRHPVRDAIQLPLFAPTKRVRRRPMESR